MADSETRRILILGSTGSIGAQTLDVARRLNALHDAGMSPVRLDVVGLAAGRSADVLLRQADEFDVRELALADDGAMAAAPEGANLRRGPDAAERLVREVEADIVLGAMVGFAGLPALMAAIELGRDIALANKETLVAAGELIVAAAERSGARLLPVDSEHSGVWQCLASTRDGFASPPLTAGPEIRRITLTASGGALRDWPLEKVRDATPGDCLNHPTWDMGAKVTIDCASLTNKALELIEAHWLFGIDADRLAAVIHPQSIIHAFVDFADRSVMAQLGAPDMRTPIQIALTWPHRLPGAADGLDLFALADLDFHPVDPERYPALETGFDVIRRGGSAGAVFNAANEQAVEAFIDGSIPFGRIHELTADALGALGASPVRDVADVLEADRAGREFVASASGVRT